MVGVHFNEAMVVCWFMAVYNVIIPQESSPVARWLQSKLTLSLHLHAYLDTSVCLCVCVCVCPLQVWPSQSWCCWPVWTRAQTRGSTQPSPAACPESFRTCCTAGRGRVAAAPCRTTPPRHTPPPPRTTCAEEHWWNVTCWKEDTCPGSKDDTFYTSTYIYSSSCRGWRHTVDLAPPLPPTHRPLPLPPRCSQQVCCQQCLSLLSPVFSPLLLLFRMSTLL